MTVTASPACSLPDYAMVRAFDAHLRQNDRMMLFVHFDGPDFVCPPYGSPGFTGTQDGDTMRFTLTSRQPSPNDHAFIYRLNESTDLGYIGTATGVMRDGVLAATFSGSVVLYQVDTDTETARCDAPDHRLELVRK